MVESGCERRESGPLNPAPLSVACSGHSTVLGFTCAVRGQEDKCEVHHSIVQLLVRIASCVFRGELYIDTQLLV